MTGLNFVPTTKNKTQLELKQHCRHMACSPCSYNDGISQDSRSTCFTNRTSADMIL